MRLKPRSIICHGLAASLILMGAASLDARAGSDEGQRDPLADARIIHADRFEPNFDETIFGDLPVAVVERRSLGAHADVYQFNICADTRVYIDIDETAPSLDAAMALFESAGGLIAFDDDAPVDPGSRTPRDPFIGEILLAPGTYYLAVLRSADRPRGLTDEALAAARPLQRPDAERGGRRFERIEWTAASFVSPAGADVGDSEDEGETYRLCLSLEEPCAPSRFSYPPAGEAYLSKGSPSLLGSEGSAVGSVGGAWRLPVGGGSGAGGGGGGAGSSPNGPGPPGDGPGPDDPRPGDPRRDPTVVPGPLSAPLAAAALVLLTGRRPTREETAFSWD